MTVQRCLAGCPATPVQSVSGTAPAVGSLPPNSRRRRNGLVLPLAGLAVCLAASTAMADPWLAPGDLRVRHDIEVLADAGLLRGPVTTWPVSWPDVARDLDAARSAEPASPAIEAALRRLRQAAGVAARAGWSEAELSVAGASDPARLRDFADTPREQAEASVGASWLGARFAGAVHVAIVSDPEDGQSTRLDGSYAGMTVGNFMISAGYMQRWWGPGWDDSLLLSTNARPMPTLTVERNYTDPSTWPVLRWFGPWRASIALGQAEGSDVAVPDTRFLAARLNFKPRPWLEFGLSRTAQWCGEGRPCSWSTFVDLMLGRDNLSASLTIDQEPGNQMAGYDFRLRSPWRRLPVALYGQVIGEDEAGGLPSKFLGNLGAETWGDSALGSWRARVEYTDTACSFMRSAPQFNCAYRNGLYPQGYTYRGRIIGASLDGDGRMYTVAGLVVRPSGDTYSLALRKVELNRDAGVDPAHTLSPGGAAELTNVEFRYETERSAGRFAVGLGYDDYSRPAGKSADFRAFLRFARGF